MIPDSESRATTPEWFCLRAKTRTEHIAAANLAILEGVEPFAPRLRILRSTRRGRVWFVEPLFPGYLFARFDRSLDLRRVRHNPGVTGMVEFGGTPITIPPEQIDHLRALIGPEEICEVREGVREGDEVEIVGGALRGIEAVVTRVMPARDRVRVLLEFLGQLREVEISGHDISTPKRIPTHLKKEGES